MLVKGGQISRHDCMGVMQKGDRPNQLNPIMFGGRSIRSHEENYPINQLEQAAIVEGYKDNYHLLFGRETFRDI